MAWKRQFWGLVILVIGIILLLGQTDILNRDLKRTIYSLWPIILIFIGLYILYHYWRRHENRDRTIFGLTGDIIVKGSRQFERTFGDARIEADDIELDGLSSSLTFGDTFVNLAGGKLKPGVNRINLSSTFGDITVLVPAGIEAEAMASNTFGDIDVLGKYVEGIGNSLNNKTAGYDLASAKVHITARTTFGDIKIYRS